MGERWRPALGAALLGGSLVSAAIPPGSAVAADAARAALVIGNATYEVMPALPGCAASAHAVAVALTRAGFAVSERHDLSNGEMSAAAADLAAKVAGPPAGSAVIYVCGYAIAYEGRSFLLPVSAKLARPTDALTQGVLAASLPSSLARAGATAGLVLLDSVTAPGAPAFTMEALASGGSAPGIGVAAVLDNTAQAETPMARTFAADISPPTVEVSAVLGALAAMPASQSLKLWTHGLPAPSFLIGGPPPPPRLPAIAAAPPPPPPPTPPPAPASTAAPETSPALHLPDEDLMTGADRRRVQLALAHLGYYDGVVDGIFGPDTRAAIRRFQHEIGAPMTGRLAAGQADQIVAPQK